MAYEPPVFDLGIPDVAMQLVEKAKEGTRFRMSELSRIQTGVNKLEAEQFEEKVEHEALTRLKEVQENAYKEAFDLGLVEGERKAFEENNAIILEKLGRFDSLMRSIEKVKSEMLAYNEAHIVQLAFHIGQRLAAHEISINPEATLELLRQAIELAQTEEEIQVRVAPDQIEFLEEIRRQSGRESEFLKNVKLEPDPSVEHGGCVVRNNYGEIDSRFGERVGKLWDALKDSLVRVKSELKSA